MTIDVDLYIDSLGTQCPKCESGQIEGESVTTGGGDATQEMNCLACGYNWTDYYKLVNIVDDDGSLMR